MSGAPRRWLPIILGALTFVIVLTGLGVIAADWTARNVEMRSLVTRIEASEAAMGTVQDQVTELAARYQAQLPLDEATQAQMDEELKAIAASGRDAIASAGDGVGDVRWLAWHRDVGAAEEAYLAHNRAWVAYLARAAEDPAEFGRQQEDVNTTFAAAQAAVVDAVPLPALFDISERVDTIFAPPALPEGAGQAA